jgi:hypothetical protein
MNNLFHYFTKISNSYIISFEKIGALSLLLFFLKKMYMTNKYIKDGLNNNDLDDNNNLDDNKLDDNKKNYLYYTCSICCKRIKSYDLIYKYDDKVFCSHNCRKIIDE